MKTTLLSILLLGAFTATAQDFRALPPAEQPNAADLDYFGGKNPNVIPEEQPDKGAIELVTGFLNDLVSNQLEAAHQRMAEGFVAYGSGYNDKLETNDLLNQWERNGQLFTDRHLTIETTSTTLVQHGNNRGLWVYVKGVWSATDKREQGKLIRIPFHSLARVSHDRIERTYTSYGNDQLFYDLGFAPYASPSTVVERR
ncbi:MAG: hypothetical protein H7Z72_15510 [Bacteroidetes bacterium]|nr:hypothetical protein [Fibrella sp.]